MSLVEVDIDDLRAVLAELGRSTTPPSGVTAAADRLRDRIEPSLLGHLSDPHANTAGAAHRRAGQTERQAAWRAMPKSGTDRLLVLQAIAESDAGLTDAEIADTTGLYRYTAAPRRVELMKGGWVRDSGRTRTSGSHVAQIVWILTDEAAARLKERP